MVDAGTIRTTDELANHDPTERRPLVTVSYAQTLDGRLATRSGSSQWVSGPESLQMTHLLRAEHDAILVGVGTVLADDPRLTVRLVEGRDPLRVIVDSRLRLPLDANVLAGGAASGTLVAVTADADGARCHAITELGAQVVVLPADTSGHVDLAALLVELGKHGVRSVMVEGGAALITSFLRGRLVDRVVITVAPKILGQGIEAVGDLGIDTLSSAIQIAGPTIEQYGVDIVIDGQVRYPGEQDG